MHIRHRPINEITEGDLLELIEHQDSETKLIDYKKELHSNDRPGSIELLSDVSSFANASGGHLVFGMNENKGIPVSLTPLILTNPDAVILQLEQKIRDGISPRIHNIEIGEVRLSSTGFAIVIRIPRSWAAPHRVTFSSHDKFYSRDSRGKYQLDVHDLRRAFLASESIVDKIRDFRAERIEAILEDRAPLLIDDGPLIVVHLVPLDAFTPAQSFELEKVVSREELLEPMRLGGSTYLYNLDGYLRWSLGGSPGTFIGNRHIANAYTQFFRNGSIEALRVLRYLKETIIIGEDIEELVLQYIPSYLKLLQTIGVNPPILIMISMLRVKGCKLGYRIGTGEAITSYRSDTLPFEGIVQASLLFPEVLLQDYDDNIAVLLHPVITTMWNAGGWPDSPLRE